MTDFVTEMMETAGVEPKLVASYTFKWGNNKKQYGKDIIEYPYFTAEKQLEIIKLISNELGTPGVDIIFFDGTYNFYTGLRFGSSHQDFTQALAQLTTELMKAGELDKEKVKEILQ